MAYMVSFSGDMKKVLAVRDIGNIAPLDLSIRVIRRTPCSILISDDNIRPFFIDCLLKNKEVTISAYAKPNIR